MSPPGDCDRGRLPARRARRRAGRDHRERPQPCRCPAPAWCRASTCSTCSTTCARSLPREMDEAARRSSSSAPRSSSRPRRRPTADRGSPRARPRRSRGRAAAARRAARTARRQATTVAAPASRPTSRSPSRGAGPRADQEAARQREARADARRRRRSCVTAAEEEHERLVTETDVYRTAVSRADELGARTAADVAPHAHGGRRVRRRPPRRAAGRRCERMVRSVETARRRAPRRLIGRAGADRVSSGPRRGTPHRCADPRNPTVSTACLRTPPHRSRAASTDARRSSARPWRVRPARARPAARVDAEPPSASLPAPAGWRARADRRARGRPGRSWTCGWSR